MDFLVGEEGVHGGHGGGFGGVAIGDGGSGFEEVILSELLAVEADLF